MANIDVTSTLVAAGESAVAALLSTDPIVPLANKSVSKTYGDKTYNTGDTVKIKLQDQPQLPKQSNVIQLDPINQGEIDVTVLQWNTGLPMSGIEQEYNLGGMSQVKRELFNPRMESTAIQSAILIYDELVKSNNFFGTPGTALKTSSDWGLGTAILNDQLAHDTGLFAAMSNESMQETSGSLAAAFNPSKDSSIAYMQGRVKEAANLNMYATSLIPNHTNGSAVADGATGMSLSADVTTGSTTIAVDGGTANGTITKNSLIWIAGNFAVQPHTKKTLSTIRYFTVAEDVTLNGSGAGTITLRLPIYGPEDPKLQNSSVLPLNNAVVGIVGGASKTYEQALVFKKKSFELVGLRLPELFSLQAKRSSYDGIPIITTMYGDGTNYTQFVRWDCLLASVERQWRHIGRAFVREVA